MDSLFDDSEFEHHEEFVLEDVADFDHSAAFRRYVSEGITLLEEWLRNSY